MKRILLAIGIFTCTSLCAKTYDTQIILDTETSWDGGDIRYPQGKPKIVSAIVRLKEGESVDYHCHDVPTLAHLTKGVMQIETKQGKRNILKAGESMVEVMNTIHRGTALKGPVEIIVFFVGSTELANTIQVTNDSQPCNG